MPAIVPAGTGGVAVYPNNTTDLLIDVNGTPRMDGQLLQR
jgi:hypothetical protein